MNKNTKANSLYLILAGIFITSLISCNLIFQKFFQIEIWIPFVGNYIFEQSVGLLPYPVTFLVTDIISEIFGRKKANRVVTAGLISSAFMLLIVTVADFVPMAPWSPVTSDVFSKVFGLSAAAVGASMFAYLVAQYIDIRVFHFWKKLTKGKHLWLRNNASTIFSQFIDTFTVLFLLCSLSVINWELFPRLLLNGFFFKVFFAAFDTPLFYLSCWYLKKEFQLKENEDLSNI
ncbi:MAG: hypothetical protein CMG09_06810 [Candidatus Marinimicrobia bacterium]|jgi:uncharacterized integral membrane protein (TIGR00697 family)|nr:hypothetical protein [Candidatus Neomarinimicrobiota bacterium]|tara:strand:- start:305 stop:1000 length:696 start_codon:yes stop_codon:yes gene_type:complete